jgi:ABC-type nickel/cobalt efflux system permease component RcnA
MKAIEILLSILMVASSFFLASSYLAEYERSNPVILVSAVLLIASLAAMLLLASLRQSRLEQELQRSQRSTRLGLQSIEERMKDLGGLRALGSGGLINEEERVSGHGR